jgi:hypothetical protein
VIGRDKYGVFPLKGKILNVKDAATAKISANDEITNLKKILGLEQGKEYKDLSSLRYGRIMVMTDQDSVTGDTPLILRNRNTDTIVVKTIDAIVAPSAFHNIEGATEKEYADPGAYDIWTERGWTRIKHVMRHKTTKRLYRVVTPTGCVDVTEDHSLLDSEASKLRPCDARIGQMLLHSFPDVSDMKWSNYVLKYNKYIEYLQADKENALGLDSKLDAMMAYFAIKSNGLQPVIDVDSTQNMYYITLLENTTFTKDKDTLTKISHIDDLGVVTDFVYDLETDNHHFHAGVGEMIVHNTDGFHIRGLLFNVFQSLWPSLYKHEGFLVSMMTPIVKVFNTSTKESKSFYNLTDFERWKDSTNQRGWKMKYYKGLGTSTEDEAKEYFKQMNTLKYVYNGETSDEAIDLAFNKKRADDRKEWLMQFNRDIVLDYGKKDIPYEEFVHKELIHFSNRDLERSINHLCDGLKESTRKILFTCLKRKLYTQEIRVAQLAASVSELSAYHHGEASLQQAIIGLAQIFVGANNMNLLMPNGQFGTRIQGGADAASPRYIHTVLSSLARKAFREEDSAILKYLDDDGVSIEPDFYIPIIPMILVNGGLGIGTGFSTNVPCYNPSDVIQLCLRMCQALDEAVGMIEDTDALSRAYDTISSVMLPELQPWYLGFTGSIVPHKEGSYISKGSYNWIDDQTVEVTELPVGTWTEDYKDFLTSMIAGGSTVLKDFESHYTAKSVKFILKLYPNARVGVERNFETEFKLVSTKNLSTNNLHLYGADGAIKKFASVTDIFRDWASVRILKYMERKHHQLKTMEHDYKMISAKVRFIQDIIDNKVKVMNKKNAEVEEQLKALKYPQMHEATSEDTDGPTTSGGSNYNYLTRMPISQLTFEKKQALEKEANKMRQEINALKQKPIQHIWRDELGELEVAWTNHKATIDTEYAADRSGAKAPSQKRRQPAAAAKKK